MACNEAPSLKKYPKDLPNLFSEMPETPQKLKNTNFFLKTSPNDFNSDNPLIAGAVTAMFWPVALVYWLKPVIWPIITIPVTTAFFLYSVIFPNSGLYIGIGYFSLFFGIVASLLSSFNRFNNEIGPVNRSLDELRLNQAREADPYSQI
jgi:hypothetical protein